MNRSQDESLRGVNRFYEEVSTLLYSLCFYALNSVSIIALFLGVSSVSTSSVLPRTLFHGLICKFFFQIV